ncbi:single-stranded-DNA-specific exonuclease RecJ [Lentilactobacillus diolivorans]|uniref:Single-stranded-DNA-specific exonuclease RecJ n=2 Tax=Lentilactobacillus diolivorans TaxID=179838 RepID=A0A0R1SHS5_9LACO|nr:single-stranded-DNA-specific exonuclease RecJ [Lentilactobacillus diolivorans]KRL65765.1 single-stranded-DNA-specific exonuclease RecJ [Lentilactobacillus diolivorans DSM 14421]GEP24105.1 single-stranded-DNA-specific exonuclease RecJ [Lentilactobacillus diolivorans]
MIDAKYDWHINKVDDSQKVTQLAKQLNIEPLIAEMLIQRGIETSQAAQSFMTPSTDDFHDPYLMHDMKKGILRIQQAIENGEQITIYGDYDADGITSTTIMYEVLNDLGANVNYYIPNRFKEGYGPNVDAFKQIIQNGSSLIITVDNGVAGFDAISAANENHCDVVVTDHHSLPETLPDALAIIHPRVKDEQGRAYPFGDLCGAGVAFKVAQALLDELPSDLIDLASIGTIADVVSLRDENRAIVKFGIDAIKNSQRPGLLALIKAAKIDLAHFDEQDIGFAIAPRLNSLGRIKDATVGVELLSTFDEDQAAKLAKFANDQNDLRKSLVDQFYQQAVTMVENSDDLTNRATLVVVGKDWHQGVLGIVASRLVDKYGRPTLVLTTLAGTDQIKGSGRSIDSFDLFAAIDPIRDQTIGFGGHHSAVGLTINADKLAVLKAQLEQAAKDQQLDLTTKPKLPITGDLPVAKVTPTFVDKLKILAPFGQDNPKPTFKFGFNQILDIKTMGKNSDHLKFTLCQGDQRLVAIAFGRGSIAGQVQSGSDQLQVVGQIGENTWNNRTTLQLMVDDLKQTVPPVIDRRTQILHQQMFTTSGTYVFFHEKTLVKLKPYLDAEAKGVMYDQLVDQKIPDKRLFVVDCPDVIDDLTQVLQRCRPKTTVLYLYKKQLVSNLGMPDRNSYAKLFRFVKENPNINIASQLAQLSKQLNIASRMIVFMIQVFLELDFITIKNRVININPHYASRDLKTAPSYHLRQEQLKTEKQLLVSNTHELVSFVENCLDS